jgi:hypothetical protein
MDELPDVPALRVLEPPAGGLARLRDRLAGPPSRKLWWWALPAIAAAVIVLVMLARQPPDQVVEMPNVLRDPSVPMYWVASTPGPRRAPPAPPPAEVRIEHAPTVAVIVLR